MDRRINKKIQILSFFAAFLLHVFVMIFLFFDFKRIETSSATDVFSISIIDGNQKAEGRKAESGKKTPLPKNEKEKATTGEGLESEDVAEIISNPLPKIPDDLRQEAFQSEAIARFYIASSGQVVNVELIKPCTNPKLNHLLLHALHKWKFAPKLYPSTKEIKVKFSVE